MNGNDEREQLKAKYSQLLREAREAMSPVRSAVFEDLKLGEIHSAIIEDNGFQAGSVAEFEVCAATSLVVMGILPASSIVDTYNRLGVSRPETRALETLQGIVDSWVCAEDLS